MAKLVKGWRNKQARFMWHTVLDREEILLARRAYLWESEASKFDDRIQPHEMPKSTTMSSWIDSVQSFDEK